jgi:hypothetical protein
MNSYFFKIKHYHFRTGVQTAITVGVIYADDEETAINNVHAKFGNNNTAGIEVYEITEEGISIYIPA